FVISVDPPITELEIEYLQRIKPKAAKLLYVLNKIDYVRPTEQSRVAEFLWKTLQENSLWSRDATVFSVSAREALEAKQLNDQAKLASSGIAKIESYLCSDLVEQKGKLLQQAARDKAIDVLADAIAEVRLRIRALEMPLDELASKCRTFEEALASIGEQRRITGDILDGERRRLRDELEQRIESLRAEAKSQLTAAMAKKALGSLET